MGGRVLLVALLCLTCACTDAEKGGGGAPAEVTALKVLPQRLPLTVELSGRVSAYRKAEVRPQVGGILQKQLFAEGSLVREGQSLYKIDPDTHEALAASARAALASAEARLVATRQRRERRRALLGSRAVSRQDYEDADAEFLQAAADVDVCRAALRTAEIQLRYTDVLAPITGRIGKSSVTQGALVTANQPDPLAVIQQLDPVYVDMTRSIRALLRLRDRYASGSLKRPADGRVAVRLMLENQKPYPLEGELQFSDITVDESTGMVLLRAVFPNPDGILLPGMYVRAVVDEGVEEDALLVPQLAVRRNARGDSSVFVVGGDGVAEERAVTVMERVGSSWLVEAGLRKGEAVVVEGQQHLRHGDRVNVRPGDG